MTPRTGFRRAGAAGLALCAGLITLSACTSDSTLDGAKTLPAYRLVAFDSCDDALNQVRTAAKDGVGPYGFGTAYATDDAVGAGPMMPAVPAPNAAPPQSRADAGKSLAESGTGANGATPDFSGTNTNEAGVDEPDLVKTDGKRILVVHQGMLKVIDAATREVTGSVNLAGFDAGLQYAVGDLLISRDHALILINGMQYGYPVPTMMPDLPNAGVARGGSTGLDPEAAAKAKQAPGPNDIVGPQLVLVDLSGTPHVLSRLRVDGAMLDARQTGSIARVVVNSTPRITFPNVATGNVQQRTKVNQQIIDQATLDKWLPRIEVTTGSTTTRPQIGCEAISRPTIYSGTNMLTVLSLDLASDSLNDPQPVSIVADGQTVYSNGDSLYVATDMRWRVRPMVVPGPAGKTTSPTTPADPGTTVYQFDTSKPGRPRFVAGGGVPGYLINQYAMSSREGYLRVATTTGNSNWEGSGRVTSQSGVYVLKADEGNLKLVGKVEGLGKGEKIYSVRFLDSVAYVVTFKQTDPLYTVDLTEPTKPRVRGALKINGYSSYLHPVSGGRLIGIGQDVNERVQSVGTQVSLFDVSNLDDPRRIGLYTLPGANSEAEFDPHAFLYWPSTGLLVVPVNSYGRKDLVGGDVGYTGQTGGALVLRVSGSTISQVGNVVHPSVNGQYNMPIRRSLVIGSTLWTVSDSGLLASDLTTLAPTGWISLS